MPVNTIALSQARAQFGDALLTLLCLKEPNVTTKMTDWKLVHSHEYYELHLIINGQTEFQIEDKTVALGARQLFIIPPKTNHLSFWASTQKSSDAEELVLGLTLEAADGDSGYYNCFLASLMFAAGKPIALSDELFWQIVRCHDGFAEKDLRSRCKQTSEVYSMFFALFDTINGFKLPTQEHDIQDTPDVNVMLDLLVNMPTYTLSDIAGMLGYSYRHTTRIIREKYGDSLSSIRRRRMLSSAKALLTSHPDMTIETVAHKSGFSGAHTMIRVFNAKVGMTPTEYRTQNIIPQKQSTELKGSVK